MHTKGTWRLAAWAMLAILANHAAIAADGDIDPTFGDDGLALTGIVDGGSGASACGPVVQPDGRILLCSTRLDNGSSGADLMVARFTIDGQLDPDFSFDGKATIDFDGGLGDDAAISLALQADGGIVVVGTTSTDNTPDSRDFAIARLLPNGDLDPAFGSGTGKRTVAFDLDAGPRDDVAADVAIQADGKILVAGSAKRITGSDFALVRLLQDGTADASFNLTGKVTVAFDLAASSNDTDTLVRMRLDDEGRILLVGNADNGVGAADFAIARLLQNGQPDNNFDADGRTTLAFDLGGSNNDQGAGMTVQRNGRLVVIGIAALAGGGGSGSGDFAVARLLPDGTPDPDFGIGGKTIVPFDLAPSGTDVGLSVIEEANGRLLLAGGAIHNNATFGLAAALARLRPDGTLDLSFGTQGKRTYQFGLAPVDTQAFMNFAYQGSSILIGGIVGVDNPAPNPVDNFIVRIENDLLFADGFE